MEYHLLYDQNNTSYHLGLSGPAGRVLHAPYGPNLGSWMTHSHPLFFCAISWMCVFILVQSSADQITGVIAFVMVQQFVDHKMMDTEVNILWLPCSHRSQYYERWFPSWLSSKCSFSSFTAGVFPIPHKLILKAKLTDKWQKGLALWQYSCVCVILPGDECSNSICHHALITLIQEGSFLLDLNWRKSTTAAPHSALKPHFAVIVVSLSSLFSHFPYFFPRVPSALTASAFM